VTVSNQCLFIPPSHALAREMYDLQTAQSVVMNHMHPALCQDYDATKQPELSKALETINDAIGFLHGQYRHERGGDESCTVSLTYGPNGFPVVDGRGSKGEPFIYPAGALKTPVRH
jgi:hypothetical protein